MTTARFGHWTVVLVGLLLYTGLVQEPFIPRPSGPPNLIRLTDRNVLTLTTDDKARLSGGDLDGQGVKGSPSLQAKPEPPKIAVTCTLHNHPYDLYDAQTQKAYEKDDWRVHCTVTYKNQKLYDDELPLARPTEYRDAMLAVDEFRTKRAPQLVKEWEDAAKRK